MIRAWLAFAAVAVLLLAGTGLLSRHVVLAERARLTDEALGQALWSVDSAAAALLVAEAGRPPDQTGADGALTRIEVDRHGILLSASGRPPEPGLATAVAALGATLPAPGDAVPDPLPPQTQTPDPFFGLGSNQAQGSYSARSGSAKALQQATLDNRSGAAQVRIGAVVARWHGSDLLLVRRLARGPGQRVQAAVLDQERLRDALLPGVEGILPGARLEAATAGEPGPDRLAVLPLRLVAAPRDLPLSATTLAVLILAWTAVLAGLAGTAAALLLAQRLAERRATFVSAVTHELRTPLTALRLHADLLADPRVGGDAGRRDGAVAVLRGEAQRLARLIDNVLDYARLERRRPPQPRAVPLSEVLEPLLPRLAARLGDAGLELVASAIPVATLRCDPEAVDRILVNLADNAAKYAATASDRRVDLDVTVGRGRVRLALRDRGPGLAADLRDRVFVPFTRSAEAAAGSAPGVGLGLALCRRLARAQRGDLRLEEAEGGGLRAVLELPLA